MESQLADSCSDAGKRFDSASVPLHHGRRHQASSGAEVSCHLPGQTAEGNGGRRDRAS